MKLIFRRILAGLLLVAANLIGLCGVFGILYPFIIAFTFGYEGGPQIFMPFISIIFFTLPAYFLEKFYSVIVPTKNLTAYRITRINVLAVPIAFIGLVIIFVIIQSAAILLR